MSQYEEEQIIGEYTITFVFFNNVMIKIYKFKN